MSNGNTPNYMNWNNNKAREAALKVDHIADKAKLGIEVISTGLISVDAIEKELLDMSNAEFPPTQVQIRSVAHRLDAVQKQLQQGLERLKDMMTEIDKATDSIQGPRTNW